MRVENPWGVSPRGFCLSFHGVIPAKAGTSVWLDGGGETEVPAFAGMTWWVEGFCGTTSWFDRLTMRVYFWVPASPVDLILSLSKDEVVPDQVPLGLALAVGAALAGSSGQGWRG